MRATVCPCVTLFGRFLQLCSHALLARFRFSENLTTTLLARPVRVCVCCVGEHSWRREGGRERGEYGRTRENTGEREGERGKKRDGETEKSESEGKFYSCARTLCSHVLLARLMVQGRSEGEESGSERGTGRRREKRVRRRENFTAVLARFARGLNSVGRNGGRGERQREREGEGARRERGRERDGEGGRESGGR